MIVTGKKIIDFLEGKENDYLGRSISDIIDCDDVKMEQCHDQVQWMFPLHEESAFATTYPIVTKEVIEEAKKSKTILPTLQRAAYRMEQFYAIGGFEDIDKQRKWCTDRNHNLLRITRIIRCLRLFGLEHNAQEFYKIARKAADRFFMSSNPTFAYWKKALEEDVWESLRD